MKVFKYHIPLVDVFQLLLPLGSKILSFQEQEGNLYIWALVDEDRKLEPRFFNLFGTGNPIEDVLSGQLNYIGTVQSNGFVWHLFEDIT